MDPQAHPDSTRCAKVIDYLGLSFLGLAAAIPFLCPRHTLPIPSFYGEWLAIALGVGACTVFLTAPFWKSLSIPKIALHILLLIAWIALQSLVVEHIYTTQALLPALYLGWAAVLIVVAGWLRQRLTTETAMGMISWFLLAGGILQSLAGLTQYLDLDGVLAGWVTLRQTISINGNIAQANNFATHVTLGALALIYLQAQRRIPLGLALPILAIFAIVLTLASSRSVWLYTLATVVLSAVLYWKARGTVHRRLAVLSMLFLVLFMIAQFLMPLVDEWLGAILADYGFGRNRLGVLTALGKGIAGAHESRFMEWGRAWTIFLQAPIVGVGMGQYAWHSFTLYALPEFADHPTGEVFSHAHNLFMQVIAELGIIGLLLLVLLLASWIWQFLRGILTPNNWLIIGVLLILFIHSNLEYPLWYSHFLGVAAIMLGLGDNRSLRFTFTPWLGRTASAAVLVLAFGILALTYGSFRKLENVNLLIFESGPEEAASRLWAISRNPLLTPWAEAAMATHARPNTDNVDQHLARTSRVMRYQPHPIKVHRHIVFLAFAERMDESISFLRLSAAAYPSSFPRFACSLRDSRDKELQPLIAEAERIMNSPRYARMEPSLNKICSDGAS